MSDSAPAIEPIKLKTPLLDRLTEAEFAQFCLDHCALRIERNGSGQITMMPPVFTESGFANNELSYDASRCITLFI